MMTKAGHRRPAALAPHRRGPVDAGRLRPRVRLRRARASAASSTSSRRGTTSAPTSTAAARATGCGCCARSSRTPWRRRAAGRRSPAGSRVDEGLRRRRHQPREIEEILGELGELPDLWDFVLGTWEADSNTSRFGPEGEQEQYVAGLKQLTSKPVVGVGRFTSPGPDGPPGQGAASSTSSARPARRSPTRSCRRRSAPAGWRRSASASAATSACPATSPTSPIRCTQNPSMGEEFRRGWHPERIRAARLRRADPGRRRRARPGWRRRGPWACAATRSCSRRPRREPGRPRRPGVAGCPAWPPGCGCWTTGSRRSRPCPTSRSTGRAG